MTMPSRDAGEGARGGAPLDSFELCLAGDGGVLLLMEGAGLDPARRVGVEVDRGVLSVVQPDPDGRRRVLVLRELDEVGRAFLDPLPPVEIVEVYLGETEDLNELVRHPVGNVSLTYEGRKGHG